MTDGAVEQKLGTKYDQYAHPQPGFSSSKHSIDGMLCQARYDPHGEAAGASSESRLQYEKFKGRTHAEDPRPAEKLSVLLDLGLRSHSRVSSKFCRRQSISPQLELTGASRCTWEWGLASGVFSLTNGGTAGAIWMFLITCFGMSFVMLSMAEMASIAPTSGGQYHW